MRHIAVYFYIFITIIANTKGNYPVFHELYRNVCMKERHLIQLKPNRLELTFVTISGSYKEN